MTKSKFVSMTNRQRRDFFSTELRRSLDRNGLTAATLAQQLSLSYHRVHHWVTGRSMPSLQTVAFIANHLSDDELSRAGIAVHNRECKNCGEIYTANSPQGSSKLCGRRCQRQNERVRQKSGRSMVKRNPDSYENKYRLAVANFCGGCEPGGICHNGSCDLRPVSPLPLLSKTEAVFASGGTQRINGVKSK